MSIVRFLTSRLFFRHLIFAGIFFFALFWIAMIALRVYTRHGKTLTVPDLIGQRLDQIQKNKQTENFRFIVIDSVFDDFKEKGSIILQDPPAGSKVKPGRKIYLTIVATQPEMVVMPDLVDLTLRKAILVINDSRLTIDRLVFQYNIARNAVLEQRYQGAPISPGTKIPRGSSIELIVGKGLKDETIPVPDLIGKPLNEAITLIHQSAFNVGQIYEQNPSSTYPARVYRQSPPGGHDQQADFGTYINLWVTHDPNFNFKAYRQEIP